MKIGMIGQRGIPANYGGVERHVEELGARLAGRGHQVTVFSRPNYTGSAPDEYRGMKVASVGTIDTKHLDAIVHSSAATFKAMADHMDIIHYHALGPGMPSIVPRYTSKAKVVQTIHGLDGQRAKWGRVAQKALNTAEWLSAKVPDATIVVSNDLAQHYKTKYGRSTFVIPNGVNPPELLLPVAIGETYGLERNSYILHVGRLVPEKAADVLIEAFADVPGDIMLVIAGGSSHTDEYVARLHRLAENDPRVLFTGYVYGSELGELYSNAAAFVLPSYLEGMPLTLLEAGAYGRPVVVSDLPVHKEVLRDTGPGRRMFPVGDPGELTKQLADVLYHHGAASEDATNFADTILERYSWDTATDQLEAVYFGLMG
jgi:glycosyltransferase involved in cell wall biosynthesis